MKLYCFYRASRFDASYTNEITFEDIVSKIIHQQARCYLSLIPMTFKHHSNFRCSIERINNKKGYTVSNCILICWEFNTADHSTHAKRPVHGSGQWNIHKMDVFLRTRFSESFADYVWCLRHFVFHQLLSE